MSVEDFGETSKAVSAEEVAERIGAIWPEQHTIGIVEARFKDNWFSHEYRFNAVITTADWEQHYAPPTLSSYIMYQIAQALVHFSADMSEEMALKMVHEPPIGCIYDMAIQKQNIKLGMVAGQVCQRCIGDLKGLGTPEGAIDAVVQIVSLVRAEALGRSPVFDPSDVFVVMRFSSNDVNDNAWKYGIKLGIEACGMRAIRGDNIVESTHILSKIDAAIRRSRLIVAKVDGINLNVYFELGLAMGLGKDVLLVSESSLVLNLPSDLRSWECLQYDKGSYEQLKARIEKYILDTYRIGP